MHGQDHKMNFKKFWGEKQLMPRITFSRQGKHYCIYCGKESDTREHSPSKAFLSEPFPSDLTVLPACFECNNGFAPDEKYCKSYIDTLISLVDNSDESTINKNVKDHKALCDAKSDFTNYNKTGVLNSNNKIIRILTKLAVGHIVYDLTEGYGVDGCCISPCSVNYKFLFQLTNDEKEDFEEIIWLDDKTLPELGSFQYDRIFVLAPIQILSNDEITEDVASEPLAFLDWNCVQEGNYSYITWLEDKNMVHVKIIISDFLFAELIFSLE